MLGPLRAYPKRIESEEEARSINGVGDKTAKKVRMLRMGHRYERISHDLIYLSQIMEIIKTGSLRRISYERTQDVHIVLAFRGIYGVGE